MIETPGDTPKGELILYQTEDGKAQINLQAIEGTVWLTQIELAELFDTTKQNVSLHLKNIFEDNDLTEEAVVKESLTTASDGKRYLTKLYSLDAILAFNERDLLTHAGKAQMEVAQRLAEKRYDIFDAKRKQADAIKADAEDIAVLEEMAKEMEDKVGGKK